MRLCCKNHERGCTGEVGYMTGGLCWNCYNKKDELINLIEDKFGSIEEFIDKIDILLKTNTTD